MTKKKKNPANHILVKILTLAALAVCGTPKVVQSIQTKVAEPNKILNKMQKVSKEMKASKRKVSKIVKRQKVGNTFTSHTNHSVNHTWTKVNRTKIGHSDQENQTKVQYRQFRGEIQDISW